MTLYAPVLWFYSVMVSVVFGASVYEALVVHPAWSRKPPESFRGFVGTPVSRMDLPRFWVPVAPLYALSGLGTLGLALLAGSLGRPSSCRRCAPSRWLRGPCCTFVPRSSGFLLAEAGTLRRNACKSRRAVGLGGTGSGGGGA